MTERREESAFLPLLSCRPSLSVSHFRNSVNVTDDDGVQTLSDIKPLSSRGRNFADICENRTLRDGRKGLPTVLVIRYWGLERNLKPKSLK